MMKLALHLLAKDLRLLRWDVAAYAAFVIVAAVSVALGAAPGSTEWYWFVFVQMLLLAAVAAQVIQADPLVGTTALWRTQPIPRAAFVTSKLMFVAGILVMFPAAATAIAARASGLLWLDVLGAGASALAIQAVSAFGAIALASFTTTVAGFVLILIAAIGSSLALNVVAHAWLTRPELETLTMSRTIAGSGMMLVGAMAIFPMQALCLKTRRTAALAIVCLLLSVIAANAWSWDYLAKPARPVDAVLVRPANVSLEWHPDRVSIQRGVKMNAWPARSSYVRIATTWSDVPRGIVVDPVSLRATFRTPDGRQCFHEESPIDPARSVVSNAPILNARYRALVHALGDLDLERETYWVMDGASFMVIREPEDTFEQLEGQMGTLTIDVTFEVARFEAVASAPLVPGTRLVYPGHSTHVTNVSLGHDSVGAGRRLLVDARDVGVVRPGPRLPFAGETVVRHVSRGEALLARPSGATSYYTLRPLEPLPYYLTFHPMTLAAGVFAPDRVDETWLTGAELVRIEPIHLGRITRSLTINDFVVRATSRE